MQIQISLLLDRSRADTLTSQLVSQLRDAIRVGRIAPGVRLPSSRRLSEQLGIGRNTVVRAYETLETECYVESRPASGMFATAPPLELRAIHRAPAAPPAKPRAPVTTPTINRGRLSFDFAPGRANPGLFPLKTWRRLLQSCLAQGGANGLAQRGDLFGLASLRSAISGHLAAARGIIAEPGQIIIISSTAEAVAITSRLLLTNGTLVCIENPCFMPAAAAFQAAGAKLHAVPVDTEGIVPNDLPARDATLLYTTSSHQFPTGHTTSHPRREQIAAWARRTGCLILEDDRGGDFRYEGGAPQAIAAYAPDHTIHLGTFSQGLGAGIRLGYLVVPAPFVEAVRTIKALLNGGSPWLEQAALAQMIGSGSYASHIMRTRTEYRERRDHLIEALRRNFGDVEISGEAAGLHIFWQLPPGVPDAATVEALGRRVRVGVYSLDGGRVCHTGPSALSRRGLILGYAALSPKQIEQGIARLSDAVDDALDGHTIGVSDLLVHRSLASRGAASRPTAELLRRKSSKPAPRIRQQPALSITASDRAASRHATDRGGSMMLVAGLYQYPIKGLSPQPVGAVRLRAGKPFPFDRIFALARPGVAVTREEPKWAKKGLFVMLMLDEALATVQTYVDEKTMRLTARRGDQQVLSVSLEDPAACRNAEAFFHRLVPALPDAPALVRARDGHFMDKPDNVISLINLATVRALEQQWGYPIDPLRFRANIYIDGAPAWDEFNWIGSDIRIGEAVFRVDRRNGRCGATNVDPATGRRDLDIPGSLRRTFGHKDLGIYLIALADADLAVGDGIERPVALQPRTLGPSPPSRTPGSAIAPARGAFICRGCYFIYHEAQGAPLTGIVPGTRFADLPASWQCPDCGTDKRKFVAHLAET